MKKKLAFLCSMSLIISSITGCAGQIAQSEVTVTGSDGNAVTDTAETTTMETTTTTTTTTTTEPPVIIPEISEPSTWVNDNSIVISGEGEDIRAIMPYYGSSEYGDEYARVVNEFRDALDDSINIYNMCLPTSAGFYIPDDCKDSFSDMHEQIDNINNNLEDGITSVDAWTNIGRHTDEYIYSRTDHHWQPLGAYYAAEAFAEAADVTFPDISKYEEKQKDNFLGSMYYFSGYYEPLSMYPDTFTYYVPHSSYTTTYYNTDFTNPVEGNLFREEFEEENCYMIFQGGDEEITEIQTKRDNGRVLVILKDSYGNALSPYLLSGYSKIYVCDFRYFDTDFQIFLSDVGCTDLLFAITVSACQTPSHIESIESLLG